MLCVTAQGLIDDEGSLLPWREWPRSEWTPVAYSDAAEELHDFGEAVENLLKQKPPRQDALEQLFKVCW